MVQLLTHQISLNFKIVCHLAELTSIPKFAENADSINAVQLLQARYTSLALQTLARPLLLTFIQRLCLAEFAESSKLAKIVIKTNLHCVKKVLHIIWNVLPLLYPWVVIFIHRLALAARFRVAKLLSKMLILPISSRHENFYKSNVLVCLSKVLINLLLAFILMEQVCTASFFYLLAMSEHTKC